MSNIIIVSYYWPPQNAIATHRPYSWATHWSEQGHNVTVITSKKQEFDKPLDLNLTVSKEIDVIEVPFGNNSILSYLLNFDLVKKTAKTIKEKLNKNSRIHIDARSQWHAAASKYITKHAEKADIVVSTFGPEASHLIAHDIKLINPKIFWVADYRDLWSQNHLTAYSNHTREEAKYKELNIVGKSADLITTVSSTLAGQLSELLKKKVICIPNGFDLNEDKVIKILSQKPAIHNRPLRIVHTGTIYAKHRNPTPLLEALAKLQSEGIIENNSVYVDFYGSNTEVLKYLTSDPKYSPFIRLMGHVSRSESLKAQSEADLLLLLESSLPEARGMLTGKVFEYIVSGKPIICIGSDPDFDIGKLLHKTGTGSVFREDDLQILKTTLTDAITTSAPPSYYNPATNEVLQYSRKRIAYNFLGAIMDSMKNDLDRIS